MPTPSIQSIWSATCVARVDRGREATLLARIDGKAKPPGSLGALETLAVRLGLMRDSAEPRVERAVLLVFAGDHGLVAEGVSSYPSAVTAAMVDTMLKGKASANAFAKAAGVELRIVDAGVAVDLAGAPGLVDAKVGRGTRNAAVEPAMTVAEAKTAVERGFALAAQEIEGGVDVIAIGEMGIGNTASSALLMHRLGPAPLENCVGAGAGHDAAGLQRKTEILARAAARTDATGPLDVLAEFGGYEIAMMAGALLGAAACRGPCVVDGFIATAAALVAIRLHPAAADYCVFAHCSAERGHRELLSILGGTPLLDLGMRLGEGTGACLAVPMVRAAARLMSDVASLEEVLAGMGR